MAQSTTRSSGILSFLDRSPTPLSQNQLPTIREVLLDLAHEKMKVQPSGIKTPFNHVKDLTINKIVTVYKKVPQATVTVTRIETRLKDLHNKFVTFKKHPNSKKAIKFTEKLDTLFDISACKCPMKDVFSKGFMVCACVPENKIHEGEFKFIQDQRGKRQMVISAHVDVVLTEKYENSYVRRQLDRNRSHGAHTQQAPKLQVTL